MGAVNMTHIQLKLSLKCKLNTKTGLPSSDILTRSQHRLAKRLSSYWLANHILRIGINNSIELRMSSKIKPASEILTLTKVSFIHHNHHDLFNCQHRANSALQ